MLTKQHITSFGILFVTFFFVSILFSIVVVRTGLDTNKSHVTKSLEDYNYVADTFFNKQNNLLATTNSGQVQAGLQDWAFRKLVAEPVQEYVGGVDNFGFLQTTTASGVNLAPHTIINCTTGEASQDLVDQNYENGCFKDALLDKANPSSEIQELGYNNSGNVTFLGLLAKYNYYAFSELDTITSSSLYAQDMLQQIPLVGQNTAKAVGPLYIFENDSWEVNMLSGVSLGNAFFDLWTATRNLTYYLIIIPTIAFGFAIMFRVQIGPQTQVTLMQAIPQILTVILVITFSYPIIALMINLAEPIRDIGVNLIYSFAGSITDSIGQQVGGTSVLVLLLIAIFGAIWVVGTAGLAAAFILGGSLIFFVVVFLRYVFNIVLIAIKLGFLIAFGPLILVWAALPGKADIVKNYFTNVAALIFGVVVMNIAWASFYSVILLGISIGPLMGFIFFFVACGLLWKAPTLHKQVASSIGVKPLFGGEEQKRR